MHLASICVVVQVERSVYAYGGAAGRGHLASGWLKVDWDGDMIGDDNRGRWREVLERGWGWGTMASVSCSEDEGSDWES